MKIKFLIVEDHAIARIGVVILLQAAGYEVDSAETGAKGFEMAMQNKYDLIFMDFGLGDTDGAEVTKKIRLQSELNKSTPIVALTAHREKEYQDQCLNSGMNDFLTKPLDEEKLNRLINKFFKS